jgi:catechol 2,3-dioxygenase-like lactoylglutathione lyase family enzyme
MPDRVGAVLYVRNLAAISAFYSAVLRQPLVYRDAYHAVLRCGAFALDIHQVPEHELAARKADTAREHHERAAVKLSFPVDSIARARQAAAEYGGELDRGPPRWVVEAQKICDGRDPEGNVFQLREDD